MFNTPYGPGASQAGNVLDIGPASRFGNALPTPMDPFANVAGFNTPNSGCFPTGCDYPQPQPLPRFVIPPPRIPSGGGQQGVCWWCNPSGGQQTIPRDIGQPILRQTIPPPPPVIPRDIGQPILRQTIPPPPPIIPQPQQRPISYGQPIVRMIPQQYQQQTPITQQLPRGFQIPYIPGPPKTPMGGQGKVPINLTGQGDLPLNITAAGGYGPTVGPFPAFYYNPQTGRITIPSLGPRSFRGGISGVGGVSSAPFGGGYVTSVGEFSTAGVGASGFGVGGPGV